MTLASYWRLVRDNRNFRLLWIAQIVSELGDWFYSVAIYSFLLEVTGSAQMVAWALVVQVLPQFFVSPAAGVVNDRVRRKAVMIASDCMSAAIVLAMILVHTRDMLWLLFLLLFLQSLCIAFFEPGRSAVIPNITSAEEIPVANALGSATWSVIFAAGAAIGGFADVAFGHNTVFVLNSLSFVASALLVGRMRFAEPHTHEAAPLHPRDLVDFSPIAEGIRYVRRDPKLLVTIFVKGGLGLMGANWVILPVLGMREFPVRWHGMSAAQGGTLGMSILLASRGAGAIIGAYLGGNLAGTDATRLRRTILQGFLMCVVGYVALGLAGSLWIAVMTLLLAHTGGSSAWTASTTLLQQQTEDRFRGRVFSAEFAFLTLAMSACSFLAGKFVDAGISPRQVAIGTGVLMLLPALGWLIAGRAWRDVVPPAIKTASP